MRYRLWILLGLLFVVMAGSGYYLWQQRPEAQSLSLVTHVEPAATDTRYYCWASTTPAAPTGTFDYTQDPDLKWTWPEFTGRATRSNTTVLINGEPVRYQETLTGYKVYLSQYRAGPYEEQVREETTVTLPAFASNGFGNRTAAGGNAWDVYKLRYEPICSTNSPTNPVMYGEKSAASNEVRADYSTASSQSSSPATPPAPAPSSQSAAPASTDTASAIPPTSSANSGGSDGSTVATSEGTKEVKSEEKNSQKKVTTTANKKATQPAAEAGAPPEPTQLYSTARIGLPADTITDAKQFATLPGAPVTVAVKSSKAVKAVTLTVAGETSTAVQDESGQYAATISAPSAVGDAPATVTISYADGTSEEFPVTIAVEPNGVVTDEAGRPITSITVTLQKQADNGNFVAWDPGTTGQANPATTDASGSYGFVAEAGTYQVVASASDGTTATSEVIEVRPMNGPVAPNLTIVAAATESQGASQLWLWIVGGLILLTIVLMLIRSGHHPVVVESPPPAQSSEPPQSPEPPPTTRL